MAYIGNSPANVGNYQIVDTTAWVDAILAIKAAHPKP